MKMSEMSPGMVFQIKSRYTSTIEMIISVTAPRMTVVSISTNEAPRLINIYVETSEIYNGWDRLA